VRSDVRGEIALKSKICCLGLFLVINASWANADPITSPSDLAPGSTYFLTFVTAGIRDALSSNIADYDAFVTAEANSDPLLAALGVPWMVIGSTPTVDAITHIGVTGPIYNLAGQLVATGETDLFDGNPGTPITQAIAAPIAYDQHGSQLVTGVWTGTNSAGMGSSPLGGTYVSAGSSTSTIFTWIRGETMPTTFGTLDGREPIPRSFFGISGPLVVPVPEPDTIRLLLVALVVLSGTPRRWRQTRNR
jgi:hypothetical protein